MSVVVRESKKTPQYTFDLATLVKNKFSSNQYIPNAEIITYLFYPVLINFKSENPITYGSMSTYDFKDYRYALARKLAYALKQWHIMITQATQASIQGFLYSVLHTGSGDRGLFEVVPDVQEEVSEPEYSPPGGYAPGGTTTPPGGYAPGGTTTPPSSHVYTPPTPPPPSGGFKPTVTQEDDGLPGDGRYSQDSGGLSSTVQQQPSSGISSTVLLAVGGLALLLLLKK